MAAENVRMDIKYRLIEEVLKTLASERTGAPIFRRVRQNVLTHIVNNLVSLRICPAYFSDVNTTHLTQLIAYWHKNGNSISTIRNKVSILKWFLEYKGLQPNFPTLKKMNIIRHSPKVQPCLDATLADRVYHPFVKSILLLQFEFGLTRLESMRIDINAAQKKDTLYIERKIAYNSKDRYLSIMSISQKKSVSERQKLTQNAKTLLDIIPEKVLLGMYNGELYHCGVKTRVDIRHFYARNKLAELEHKHVDKKTAYKTLAEDLGFSSRRRLVSFLQ